VGLSAGLIISNRIALSVAADMRNSNKFL
jgi:hypothetical protein